MDFTRIPWIWLIVTGVVYVVGLLVCFVASSLTFTAGFGAGGALVLANAGASAWKLKRTDFLNTGRAMLSLLGGFYIRLTLLAVCLFGLLGIFKLDPVGVVIGLSVVPAGLIVLLVLIYIANRRPKEV